jgi:small subunit ribosomal protein S16
MLPTDKKTLKWGLANPRKRDYSLHSFWQRPFTGGFIVPAVFSIDRIIFMAVRIRMKRVGAKNAPVFRIVVADGRSPRDGKFIEEIGTYQPRKKSDNVRIDLDRVKYWLSKGAQPSDTVASFIKKANKAAATAVAA